MIGITSVILPALLYAPCQATPALQCCPLTSPPTPLLKGKGSPAPPSLALKGAGGLGLPYGKSIAPSSPFQALLGGSVFPSRNGTIYRSQKPQLIAAPDNFNPGGQPSPPPTTPAPVPPVQEIPPPPPTLTPPPQPVPIPPPTPAIPQPAVTSPVNLPPRLTQESDRIAAKHAWQYFERNWNPQTGFVNSVDNYSWTTWWDQGSAILGIHAAYQLGLIEKEQFNRKIARLLQTLETLPLPKTGLPNKAYSTTTAQMRRLDNTPDPQGTSGWSALDMGRFLLGLHVLRTHYPEYSDRINRIVTRWNLSRLVKDGWLHGGIPGKNGQIRYLQEGRFGYEQYAAYSFKLWDIEAANALNNPPVKTVQVDGISLQIDERNLNNSGATNYFTNDPYVLWGIELGWTESVKPQALNLFKVQAKRFDTTGILTAVNEDSLDRPPYFLYYNVYANGQPWHAITVGGKAYPQLRFLSTKAAFGWAALMPDEPYAKKLRDSVQNLFASNRGYFSGKYENRKLGVNSAIDINTNAIILESLLYQARGKLPLINN